MHRERQRERERERPGEREREREIHGKAGEGAPGWRGACHELRAVPYGRYRTVPHVSPQSI